jgi:D-xylose transport system substrate-binding protein
MRSDTKQPQEDGRVNLRRHFKPAVSAVVALGVFSLIAAGCGSSNNNGGGGGGGGGGGTIALLLPESGTARYESQDRPHFEAKVKELCSGCNILYSNAGQDAARQQQQAEAALTKGAKVLVLDAVDAGSAGAIVQKAKAQKVPVISYDRLITNADIDYYISYDNERVGKLQGQTLVKKLQQDGKGNGTIIQINGDPADHNATLFKKGATSAISSSKLKVGKSYDTPGWLAKNAQTEMDQAITALGNTGFVGTYVANDTLAGAAIAAMKGAGIKPSTRPTTGQDAELAGIQRILTGEQFMTVYKDFGIHESTQAAVFAVALAQGKKPPSDLVTDKVNNGKKDVPSLLLTPVAVTKANIKDTVVKDKFWTASQICTKAYASACKAAGIQ